MIDQNMLCVAFLVSLLSSLTAAYSLPKLVSPFRRNIVAVEGQNISLTCNFEVSRECNPRVEFLFQDVITRRLHDAAILHRHSVLRLRVQGNKIAISLFVRPVDDAITSNYFCVANCIGSDHNSSVSRKITVSFVSSMYLPRLLKTPSANGPLLVSPTLSFNLRCSLHWIPHEHALVVQNVTWIKDHIRILPSTDSGRTISMSLFTSSLTDLSLPKDSGTFRCIFAYAFSNAFYDSPTLLAGGDFEVKTAVNAADDVRVGVPGYTSPLKPTPSIRPSIVLHTTPKPFPIPVVITSISAYVDHHPCFPILRCQTLYTGQEEIEIIMIVWDRNGANHASVVTRPNGGNQSSFTLLDRGDGMYGCTIEYAVGKNRSADTHFANGTSLYFNSIRDNVCANASSPPTPPPSRLRRNVDVLPCCMSSSVAPLMPVYTEPPLAFASMPPSTLEALQGSNATFTRMTTIYLTPLADFDSVVFGLWQRGYVSVYLMTVTRDGTVIRNPNFHINTPWLGHRVTWEGNLSKKSLVFRIANCTLQDQATYGISVHLGPFKNSLTEPVYLRIKPDAKRGTLLVRNNSCNPNRNANTIILALLVSTIFAQLE